MGSNIIAHLIFFFPPHILLSAPMGSNVIAHLFFFPSTHSIRWYPNYHTFWNPYIHTIGSTIVLYIFPISLFAFHISFFNTLCVFGSRLKNQLILPFNLFLLLLPLSHANIHFKGVLWWVIGGWASCDNVEDSVPNAHIHKREREREIWKKQKVRWENVKKC